MKELISEKNKVAFEEWFKSEKRRISLNGARGSAYEEVGFYELPFEMQIGIYLAYYDSLGYYVTALSYGRMEYWKGITNIELTKRFKTRNEAFKESLIQANIIRNKEL